MPEQKIKLKGWQALVALAIFAGIVAVRLMTFNDKTDDKDLMTKIDTLLMSELYPDMAERMKAAVATGDNAKMSTAVDSVTSAKATIHSVQTSYPMFKFTSPKEVVVKVTFSLDDASGPGEKRTIYYLFEHSLLGWHYQYITTSVSYYLNFS
jgi:hypothetical protein